MRGGGCRCSASLSRASTVGRRIQGINRPLLRSKTIAGRSGVKLVLCRSLKPAGETGEESFPSSPPSPVPRVNDTSQQQEPLGLGLQRQQDRAAGNQPSVELLELVKLQLDMLVSMLEAQIREEEFVNIGVRCAVYWRTPKSIAARTLNMQLVATSDDAWEVPEKSSILANEFSLGDEMAGAEEAWVVKQPMIVLPDNGGLVLPLVHRSFLVGLLLVERTLQHGSDTMLPPVNDVFGPAEIGIIKQSGIALALSCAMDLRAVLERSGTQVQQERMQRLIRQATKPLSTLKTLGRMLQPRLPPGDPERDMTDSIVAQGQYLGEIVSQIQNVLNPSVQSSPKQYLSSYENAEQDETSSRQRSRTNTRKREVKSYPALPSSSIGADNWDSVPSVSSLDDDDDDDESNGEAVAEILQGKSEKTRRGQIVAESCNLFQVVTPLLDSAHSFSKVKHVEFSVEYGSIHEETMLRVDYSIAKNIFSTMIDGALMHVVAGDAIEVLFKSVSWEKAPGVLIDICLQGNDTIRDIYSNSYIEALEEDVRDVGGWFRLNDGSSCSHREGDPLLNDSDVLLSLWLPVQ
ncbi:hypothetical protein M9435_001114 [Picochlorum sp. BPE23]|nr:hypothetical protein M9435_001114 [Picochlorum sp. BPE23]